MATISVYNAPKPRYSGWKWFKFIAARIVFPPVLLWDLIKLGANKWLGEWVSDKVLVAQNMDFEYAVFTDEDAITYNEHELICKKHEVITHDGAHLDTFEIEHIKQTTLVPQYQKYIINLIGNGVCYENIIDHMKGDARTLEANVIGFNFRGVAQSNGRAKSSDDLVTDGIAQVQRLLDQGVSPQNITLKGHSLGGGVASLVAQHFHQLGQPVNLFNSRSFSSITNYVVGDMRRHLGERRRVTFNDGSYGIVWKDSIRGKILSWLAKPFVKFGVALVKWEIDAGSAFKNLPEAYKDYIVVRSSKEKRGVDDAVIPHYASIHKELTSNRRAKKAQIDKEVANLEHIIKKADPIAKPALNNAKNALAEARKKISSDRKMATHLRNKDGHNSNWSQLKNRAGKSSDVYFKEFVERVEEDHAVKNVTARTVTAGAK